MWVWGLAGCLWAGLATQQSTGGEFAVERHDGGVVVKLDGELFTDYRIDLGPKPILWPIVGPTGASMTRDFPLAVGKQRERLDHPHHRSLWFTHGDVNGIDFWSERKGATGQIVHRDFVRVEGGERAELVTHNDWLTPDGQRVLEDERRLAFAVDGDTRIIDFDIILTASDGPVVFGDTKEGTFGIRVPTAIDVDTRQGGRIVNSAGLTDGAAWGKAASWVDYQGPIGDELVGIAILNHPASFRYPTHWHVRTYGLFAANPFGLHDFERGDANGRLELAAGESIALYYRILLHRGDEQQADVAAAFARYAEEEK